MHRSQLSGLLNRKVFLDALRLSCRKLDPRVQWRNPVMFVVWLGSVYCTVQAIYEWIADSGDLFLFFLSFWLWLTVFFANFAESIAEGRGEAQAASLRATRSGTRAKKMKTAAFARDWTTVDAGALRKGDFVLVETGDMIPTDGEAVAGIATVDESAITGESAPVIRESGGDRSAVT